MRLPVVGWVLLVVVVLPILALALNRAWSVGGVVLALALDGYLRLAAAVGCPAALALDVLAWTPVAVALGLVGLAGVRRAKARD